MLPFIFYRTNIIKAAYQFCSQNVYNFSCTSQRSQTSNIMKGGFNVSVDLKEQYDKIFRYCYFKVRDKSLAEDLTQETFLRFLEIRQKQDIKKELHYLYTVAGNLCTDSYRRKSTEELTDDIPDDSDHEDDILTGVALSGAMRKLSTEDREIIMLRYINEVPVGTLSKMYGVSRFSMSRRISRILAELKNDFNVKEG